MLTLQRVVQLMVAGAVVLADKRPITFDDPLGSLPPLNIFNGSWFSDTELAYVLDYSLDLVKYNVKTGSVTTVVNSTLMMSLGFPRLTFSADKKWAYFISQFGELVYRHSFLAKYKLVELETWTKCDVADGQYVQLMVWAPVGHAFAFVRDNDVFYQSVHCPAPNAQRITNSPDYVFNGIADWVYEEEVLEDSKALWFSPDGKKLLFSTMDDTNVHNMSLSRYNDPGSLESQYVELVTIRYPKAGTPNPVITLNYVDLEQTSLKYQSVKTPVELVSNDNILGPVVWADNSYFSTTWMTRIQNLAYTLLCNSQDLKCTPVLEHVENKGWLNIKPPVFKNQAAFFMVLPQDQGGGLGNFRQLCLVSANRVISLTSGLDVVEDIVKYDVKTNTVFYTGTAHQDSAQMHLYAANGDGKSSPTCLSCQSGCRYNKAEFSEGGSYYILHCPLLVSDLYSKDGRFISHLVNNTAFEEELNKLDLPLVRNLNVSGPNGFTIKVRMYYPSSLKEDGSIKYPVLFNVYSGPDSNNIIDRTRLPRFEDYLISSRGIIVINVNGRGSSLRGDNIKFEMYRKLGGPEIDDILEVARYLQKNFPYVDAKRTAIWGWSYGGYATAMTLAKDTDQLFKCGLSIAPVTNWLYYDTVYTERYMGLPTNDSNLQGYIDSDVTSKVENFRNKLYYLIHGNFDDNVHYQQSMALSKALERADILFYQQSYPDESHGLSSVTNHLKHSVNKFWTKCFQLKEPAYNSSRSPGVSSRRRHVYRDSRTLKGKIKTPFDFI